MSGWRVGLWVIGGLALSACGGRGRCGEGTVDVGRECAPTLQCGEGTVAVDGLCWPEGDACGPGTVSRGGQCWALTTQSAGLPFPAGDAYDVTQGNHGYFSHSGADVYAVDFNMPEGSEIAAMRAGRVLAARDDSSTGCAEESCADQANYVILDHGDGTCSKTAPWLSPASSSAKERSSPSRATPAGRAGPTCTSSLTTPWA
jgi:hypothetical protein